eukprot:5695283-Amphidinium_carterae.1
MKTTCRCNTQFIQRSTLPKFRQDLGPKPLNIPQFEVLSSDSPQNTLNNSPSSIRSPIFQFLGVLPHSWAALNVRSPPPKTCRTLFWKTCAANGENVCAWEKTAVPK